MAMRHMSWTAAAAAIFLAACDQPLDIPPPVVPPPPPPAVTDSYVVTSANRLVGFNRATPATAAIANAITGLAAGETVIDLAFRPNDGLLYALVANGTAARVVTIAPTTGVATAVSTLVADAADATAPYAGLVGTRFGIDFNPVPDRLRVISDTGQNLRINVATGATITDTALNGAGTGASATSYSNAFNAACRTMQFAIDPVSDRLFLQNPPNDGVLTAIGGLGVDATSVGGFDIATSAAGANTAFAVLNVAGVSALYSINTSTGAATQVAALTLNAGETAAGFATRPQTATPTQAAGELTGYTAAGAIGTFNRGSPAKLCTTGTVTGLPTGTTLLGLDNRPASGQLIGLVSDNSLVTIGADGLAAPLCPLVTDPTDVTAAVHGAADRRQLRRRLQSGSGSPAGDHQHRPEPAHQCDSECFGPVPGDHRYRDQRRHLDLRRFVHQHHPGRRQHHAVRDRQRCRQLRAHRQRPGQRSRQ